MLMRKFLLLFSAAAVLAIAQISGSFNGTFSSIFTPASPTSNLLAPTAYWVFNSNGTTINSLAGTHVLTSQTGTGGANPLVNAGGLEGQGILTGRPASAPGNLYNSYMDTTSTGDLTMSNTSATVAVCGVPNPWEVNSGGSAIPFSGVGAFRKSGEWTLALNASSSTPFQVTVGGSSISAGVPPTYSSFANGTRPYPQQANATFQCTFGMYDSAGQTVSAAYNDGAAGTATATGGTVTLSAQNVRVAESSLANTLTVAAFWPVLLTQSERATLWNGMLRNYGVSFNAGGITSWTGYRINPATDLNDNAWSQSYGSYVRESEFASFRFRVTPIGTPALKPAFAVKYSTLYQKGVRAQNEHDIGIRVDDAYFGYAYAIQQGFNVSPFALPNDGASHIVSVRVGTIGASVYGAVNNPQDTLEGTSLDSVYVPPGYSITPLITTPASTTLIYGDSIAGGTGAEASTSPYLQQGPRVNMGWDMLCRYANPKCFPTAALAIEAYGGRLLQNDCPNQSACTAFFDNVIAKYKNITTMWVAMGVNDISHTPLTSGCLAAFTQQYGWLLDAFAAHYPSGKVYAQSMTNTSAVTADSAGCGSNTTASYRTAISTVCAARSSFCTFVDGTASAFPQLGQTPVEISSDNLHPSALGHVKYAQAVAAIVGNGGVITFPQ